MPVIPASGVLSEVAAERRHVTDLRRADFPCCLCYAREGVFNIFVSSEFNEGDCVANRPYAGGRRDGLRIRELLYVDQDLRIVELIF